jgi:hypothetical protein
MRRRLLPEGASRRKSRTFFDCTRRALDRGGFDVDTWELQYWSHKLTVLSSRIESSKERKGGRKNKTRKALDDLRPYAGVIIQRLRLQATLPRRSVLAFPSPSSLRDFIHRFRQRCLVLIERLLQYVLQPLAPINILESLLRSLQGNGEHGRSQSSGKGFFGSDESVEDQVLTEEGLEGAEESGSLLPDSAGEDPVHRQRGGTPRGGNRFEDGAVIVDVGVSTREDKGMVRGRGRGLPECEDLEEVLQADDCQPG